MSGMVTEVKPVQPENILNTDNQSVTYQMVEKCIDGYGMHRTKAQI